MNSRAVDILKVLPDFEDYMKLAEEIADTQYKKLQLDAEIKAAEADIVKVITTNEKYFQGGKPPSMSYIESTYKVSGINGELIPMRQQLAKLISLLEEKRIKFEIYKNMMEIWRTLSASERSLS